MQYQQELPVSEENGFKGLLYQQKNKIKQHYSYRKALQVKQRTVTPQYPRNHYQIKSTSKSPIKQITLTIKQAIETIMKANFIIFNNKQFLVRGQVVITNSGLKYILKIIDKWINLSWLHSVKKIERNKLLLLYYHLNPITDNKKPTLQPQIFEFNDNNKLEEYYQALKQIHIQYHDNKIQRYYHQLI